jgi:hypothetical protein
MPTTSSDKKINISQIVLIKNVSFIKDRLIRNKASFIKDVYGNRKDIKDIEFQNSGICFGLSKLYIVFALLGEEALYFEILRKIGQFKSYKYDPLHADHEEIFSLKSLLLFIHTVNQIQSRQAVLNEKSMLLSKTSDVLFLIFFFLSLIIFILIIPATIFTTIKDIKFKNFNIFAYTLFACSILLILFVILSIFFRRYSPLLQEIKETEGNNQHYWIASEKHALAAKFIKEDEKWELIDSNDPHGKKKFSSKEKMIGFVRKKYNKAHATPYRLSKEAKNNIELFHKVHRKPIFSSSDKENAYKTYEVLYSFFGCNKNNELDQIVAIDAVLEEKFLEAACDMPGHGEHCPQEVKDIIHEYAPENICNVF